MAKNNPVRATYKNNRLGERNIHQTPSGAYNVRVKRYGITHHIGNFAKIETARFQRDEAEFILNHCAMLDPKGIELAD